MTREARTIKYEHVARGARMDSRTTIRLAAGLHAACVTFVCFAQAPNTDSSAPVPAPALAPEAALSQREVPSTKTSFKPLTTTTVGIEARVMYRAKGPALMAAEATRFAPVTVRIASQTEDNGATLYDLRFIAQKEGRFDLRDGLTRIDGGSLYDEALLGGAADGYPAALVAVTALLPEEHDGDMIAMQELAASPMVGYRVSMIALGAVWLLVPMVWMIRRVIVRRRVKLALPPPPPPTLADLLGPLVEDAQSGRLDVEGRATLERLVLGYWREKLDIERLSMRESLHRIKSDDAAGALLRAVERWLHASPRGIDGSGVGSVVGSATEALLLLEPYRTVATPRIQLALPERARVTTAANVSTSRAGTGGAT